MTRSIAVYGNSFNPPGLHHRGIAEFLTQTFDEVVIVPCGPRPDKPSSDTLEPVYRAAMCDIAFRGLARVRVELFDLEQASFTPSVLLDGHFAGEGEVWHVVNAEMIARGASGESKIQQGWQGGVELWARGRFAVIARVSDVVDAADLPPHSRLLRIPIEGSSARIRERLFKRESIDDLLHPAVAEYVHRYRLYRGNVPIRATTISLESPRVLVVADERNPRAQAWKPDFLRHEDGADPNCIVVLGGDGMMLSAVQEHWRLRLPFFGVNAGHLGFLLNHADDVLGGRFPPSRMVLRQLPMLYIETQGLDGRWTSHLTFNDAWVERSSGQSAWLEVRLNDQVRMSRLICDGALVSTAAASTAYARSMGATPLLADTPAWLFVGSNVMQPMNWKSALLSLDARVELKTLDPVKRPLRAYVHGIPCGEVLAIRARMSRIATAELAFCPEYDMAEKIAQIQFPRDVLFS